MSEIPRTGPRWIRFIKCCFRTIHQPDVSRAFARLKPHRSSLGRTVAPSRAPTAFPRFARLKTYRRETRNLVTQTLGRNDRDIIRDALVRRKVEREPRVILFDDLARRLPHARTPHRRRRQSSRAFKITRASPSVRASDRALDAALPRAFVLSAIVLLGFPSSPRPSRRAFAPSPSPRAPSPVPLATRSIRRAPFSPSSCERDPCRRVRARRAETDRAARRARGLGLASVDRAHTDLYGLYDLYGPLRPTARAAIARAPRGVRHARRRHRDTCLPLAPRASS